MLRAIMELTPIAIAILAILTASRNFKHEKTVAMLSMVCAFLLIVAQSSWYVLVVILGKLEQSDFSNLIWTVFNCLVMSLVILVNKK